MKRITACILLASLAIAGASAAIAQERVTDSSGFISLAVPPAWQAWPTEQAGTAIYNLPNSNLFTPGLDLERPGLVAFKPRGVKELLPTVQVARIDLGMLAVSEETRQQLERTLEKRYSAEMGTRFRLFSVTQERIGGVRAFRVSGVYTWRTNNIRMVQYLIPGNYNLYAATYVAQEREFQRHLPEAEQILASLTIGDPPVDVVWFGDLLRWIVLVLAAGAVIWGIAFANSLRPSPATNRIRGARDSEVFNPFQRRK